VEDAARKLPAVASVPLTGNGEPANATSVPSGFRRYPTVFEADVLTYTNVPCAAAGVGVGVAPGGVGIGVGVGVGFGFALTPPHPARKAIISRARTNVRQAERGLLIKLISNQGER
jgi:hypothetical protein